jgi:hypothetical protein
MRNKRDAARRATQRRPWLIAGLFSAAQDRHIADQVGFSFKQHFPRIAFIGVWDTVDAYGMPFDELKEAIDRTSGR